jgi:serine/threonine protein phosphatase PrpC
VALQKQELIEWGVASRPIADAAVSGDLHLVNPFDGGVLLAVIDGLGHGAEAAEAARTAAEILERHARDPVVTLIERCHQALVQTRGAVMTLVSVCAVEGTITWIGVGNVEGRLVHAGADLPVSHENVLLRSGLVGDQLPELQSSEVAVSRSDLLVLATDGIRAGFESQIQFQETPGQIAERILNQHFKGTDDALVLVARYLGTSHE